MSNRKVVVAAKLALLDLAAKKEKTLCLEKFKDNGKSLFEFAKVIADERSGHHCNHDDENPVEKALKTLSQLANVNGLSKAGNVESFFGSGNTTEEMTIKINLGSGTISTS